MKKLLKFIKKHFFLLVFFMVIIFVFIVVIYKLFLSKPIYIYLKVKVGQGLWWVSTVKPNSWFINAINHEKEKSNNNEARIIQTVFCPYFFLSSNNQYFNDQYNSYVVLKIRVNRLKTGQYVYQGQKISVGGPIDFELTSVQFSGTIVEMNDQPIYDKLTKKTVYLVKNNPQPEEYDNIKINDGYFDGKRQIFKIVDKSFINGNINLKAKISVKEINRQWIYCEEETIATGKPINFITPNSILANYLITKIE